MNLFRTTTKLVVERYVREYANNSFLIFYHQEDASGANLGGGNISVSDTAIAALKAASIDAAISQYLNSMLQPDSVAVSTQAAINA